MYVLRLFPGTIWLMKKSKFIEKLVSCDLCLGVWVYFFLALLLRENMFYFTPVGSWLILFEYAITGIVTSFLVHVFSIGWNAKFTIIEVH